MFEQQGAAVRANHSRAMRRFHLIRSAGASGSGETPGAGRGAQGMVAPEVQALLDHVRVVAPLPRDVRARALARARAALEAAAASEKPRGRTAVAQVVATDRAGLASVPAALLEVDP